jgi:hypothetical protein
MNTMKKDCPVIVTVTLDELRVAKILAYFKLLSCETKRRALAELKRDLEQT